MPPPRVLILRLYATSEDATASPVMVCEDPSTGRQTPFASAEALWRIVQASMPAGTDPRATDRANPEGASSLPPPPKESP